MRVCFPSVLASLVIYGSQYKVTIATLLHCVWADTTYFVCDHDGRLLQVDIVVDDVKFLMHMMPLQKQVYWKQL